MVSHIFIHSKLDEARLSSSQFRVYAHLARRADGEGIARPGIESIAEVCCMQEDTARRAIRELTKRCMVEIIERAGLSRLYRLLPPEKWLHPSRKGGGVQEEDPSPVSGGVTKPPLPSNATPPEKGETTPPETGGGTPPEKGETKGIHEGNPKKGIQFPAPSASPSVAGIASNPTKPKPEKPEPPPDPRFRTVTDGYCTAYHEVFGSSYVHTGGKDGGRLKAFLTRASPERFSAAEIVRTARAAMQRSQEQFPKATRFASSLSGFCDHFNEIQADLKVEPVNGRHGDPLLKPKPIGSMSALIAAHQQHAR